MGDIQVQEMPVANAAGVGGALRDLSTALDASAAREIPIHMVVTNLAAAVETLVVAAPHHAPILSSIPDALARQGGPGTPWTVIQVGSQAVKERACVQARQLLNLFVALVTSWHKAEAAAAVTAAVTQPAGELLDVFRASLDAKETAEAAENAMSNPTEPSGGPALLDGRACQQGVHGQQATALDASAKAKLAYRKDKYGAGGEPVSAFVQKSMTADKHAAAALLADTPAEADRLWSLAVKAMPEVKPIGFANLAVVLEVAMKLFFGQFGQCTTAARCFLEDVAETVALRGPTVLTAAEVYGMAMTNYGTPAMAPKRPATASTSAAAGPYRPAGFAPARPFKRPKQPCRDFKSGKGCNFGDSCKYAHA